jgi:hypothetical protein
MNAFAELQSFLATSTFPPPQSLLFPIIIFVSTKLFAGVTGISLHWQGDAKMYLDLF